jgi:L-rhamnose mutarotase
VKQYALTLNLKDDPALIEQYKEYHRNVWPEVRDSLKAVGILNMNIYLLGRRMFMVMDTVDQFEAEVDFPRYLQLSPRCQEWEDLMGSFQEKVPEARADEKWALMERVFEL